METKKVTKEGTDLVDFILGLVVDIDDIRLAKAYEALTGHTCRRIGNDIFEITSNVEEKPV